MGARSSPFLPYADDIAVSLFGKPIYHSRHEFRWGSKGSFCVTIAGPRAGRFHDFETGTSLLVTDSSGRRVMEVVKQRDGPTGKKIVFELADQSVECEGGDLVATCVPRVLLSATQGDGAKNGGLSDSARALMQFIRRHASGSDEYRAVSKGSDIQLDLSIVRKEAYVELYADAPTSEAKRKRFGRDLERLEAAGEVQGDGTTLRISTRPNFAVTNPLSVGTSLAGQPDGPDRIDERIGELQHDAANFGPRVQQKTRDKNVRDIVRYEQQREAITRVRSFTYGAGSDYAKGILGHDDIIKMASQLMIHRPLFRTLVAQQFPFVFVDESQDTFPVVVEALLAVERQEQARFCLGFFGEATLLRLLHTRSARPGGRSFRGRSRSGDSAHSRARALPGSGYPLAGRARLAAVAARSAASLFPPSKSSLSAVGPGQPVGNAPLSVFPPRL